MDSFHQIATRMGIETNYYNLELVLPQEHRNKKGDDTSAYLLILRNGVNKIFGEHKDGFVRETHSTSDVVDKKYYSQKHGGVVNGLGPHLSGVSCTAN
jgi:hypothetical protein